MEEQSTAALFAAALAEARAEHPEPGHPRLAELRNTPTAAVFDHAMRLTCSLDPTEREFGLQVLQDLGPVGAGGRRPFSAQTVPHLRRLLQTETDPWLLGHVVAALGAHHGGEAVADVAQLAGHPDDGVRYRVAAALPELVDSPAGTGPAREDAVHALRMLCRDADPDVRYYALSSLVDSRLGLEADELADVVGPLLADEDDHIRTLARDHAARIALGAAKPVE